MADQIVVRHPGEGTAFWMLGGLYEVKAATDETGGAMTVMEFTIPAGSGPPPHTHDGAEAIYVLDGRLRFKIDGQAVEAGPGSFAYYPAGTTETFEPLEEVRVLVFYGVGGMDEFFAEAGEPAERREIPPPSDTPPDLERIAALGEAHGLHIQAPDAA
jgi:quercetin dioxygenase-like cupin family protein